jgi:dihydroorotate dehydrogenase
MAHVRCSVAMLLSRKFLTGSTMLYSLVRPLFFALDPETAHTLAFAALDSIARCGLVGRPPRGVPVHAMGLQFPNAVGLAAGLDKNGEHIDGLGALGFGFIEVGTVTPRPQPGNPRPRLFRLPQAGALINRMGFNNEGAEYLVDRVRRSHFAARGGILGINIGKNFDTPIERAADDYVACLRAVYAWASYIAINVSSPNTRNLRDLQDETALVALLGALTREREELMQRHGRRVPLAVKIAPDLDDADIPRLASTLASQQIDAVIATNTTTARDGVRGLRHGEETGGLSGSPLRERATTVVRILARALDGALPIIAAGGVMSGQDARQKLEAGATLVQIYTGLIYRGPVLVREAIEAVGSLARREANAL